MHSLVSVGFRVLSAVALILVVATPVSADCAGPPFLPDRFEQVRGTTFVGAVRAYEYRRTGSVVTWQVERVYAGAPLPDRLTYTTVPCYSAYVLPEVRYLFSTADINEPDWRDSVAWVLGPNDKVTHWGWAAESPSNAPRGIRDIHTFPEALEAVAPGAGEGLPPTDATLLDLPAPDAHGLWFSALLASVLAWFAIRGLRRRMA